MSAPAVAAGDVSTATARVFKKGKPSQCDPTGTGLIVNDILTPWNFPDSDPFILLHEFGPTEGGVGNVPIGMHPHRGFNEVPYLKQGHWIATDAWTPEGDPLHSMRSGCVQWGFIGSGIEHGAKFDKTYTGTLHGFQLWVNLPAANKMDAPSFQDAEPEALPVLRLSDTAQANVLVGSVQGTASTRATSKFSMLISCCLPERKSLTSFLTASHLSLCMFMEGKDASAQSLSAAGTS